MNPLFGDDLAYLRSLSAETLLTTDQAAALRHRSVAYLAKERVYGRGPRYLKDSGRIFYRLGDVLDYLAAREVATSAQPHATR